jgi:ABC-type polysaccharide/polyol phosphate transport system ATPase subunit
VNIFQNTVTLLSINAGLAPYLSGRTNIFLIGLSLGIARARIREVIDEIVEFSELEEFIDQPVQTYSSGMKSKLGFSTAMFLRPNILLIDEILGVGDRAFRKKSSKAIREKLSGNATAILVTHNEAEIKKHCNKALWIEKGRSIAFGTPKEVLKEYDLHYK